MADQQNTQADQRRAALPVEVARILDQGQSGAVGQQVFARALDVVADAFDAPTATLHAVDAAGDPDRPDLVAVADRGLPEAVRAHTRRIPFGRGRGCATIDQIANATRRASRP